MDEFLAEYKAELRKLQRNDKTQINTLSMLAEANREFADGIAAAIEHHILSCPPAAKLPALYLIDSILKNVGGPYKASFSQRLHEVFGTVWDVTMPDKRTSLSKLYGTWANLLPADVLSRVQKRMTASANGSTGRAAAVHPAKQQTRPAAISGLVPQQQQQQPPIQIPAHVMLQPQPQAMQLQQPYGAIQIVQQPPQILSMPVIGLQPQQAPTTFYQIGNNLVPVSTLPTQPLVPPPLVVQQQQQQPGLQLQQGGHTTPQHLLQHTTPQHAMQAQGLPPVSPGHAAAAWQPQQQQQHMPQPPPPQHPQVLLGPGNAGPMMRRSPGTSSPLHADVGGYGPPPPPVGRMPAAPRKASPLPSSAELTSTALDNLLANLAKSGVLASAKDQEAAAIRTTEFQQAFLKELHQGVLQKLEADSVSMRPKLRDLEFERNKRKGAAAGAGVSRSWYLAVDLWISGTTAHDEAAVHNPFAEDDEAAAASEQEDAQAMEPEDPDQVSCAISGEPFEKVFDQNAEGWFYQGVCRLAGEEAAKYGVADGSLVKVKCLAEARRGIGGASEPGAGGSGGNEEASMAAAAADAPAAAAAEANDDLPAAGASGRTAAAAASAGVQAANDGDDDEGEEQEEEDDDFGLDEYAGLAAGGGEIDTELKPAVVKQEVVQDDIVKQQQEADSAIAAAAAAATIGAKREATSTITDDELGASLEPGSAAKRARLDDPE